MAVSYGNPGATLTTNNRLTRLLQSQSDPNNGSVYGGLAHALQQGMLGYLTGSDARERQAAEKALASGMQTHAPADGVGPASPGGYQGAINSLSAMPDNPYAGRLTMDLLQRQQALKQQQDALQSQRDFQTGLLNTKIGAQAKQNQANHEFTAGQNALTRQASAEQNALKLSAQKDIAHKKADAQGNFYAVPTGHGTMLLDKHTGMAVMMGVDENGNPVQIGQPFMPTLTQNHQQTAIPISAGEQAFSGHPTPDPATGAQPTMQPRLPAEHPATPLLSPSIDPGAQATKVYAGGVGKRANDRMAQAGEAQNQNMQLDQLQHAIDNGAETGWGQDALLSAKNAAQSVFGIKLADNVGQQQLIQAIGNQLALRLRNPASGMGLPGATSNQDVSFLKSMVPSLGDTPQGFTAKIDAMRRLNKMRIDVGHYQAQLIQQNGGSVPTDLDDKLIDYEAHYQLYSPRERQALAAQADGQQQSPQQNAAPVSGGIKFLGFE